GSAGAEHLAARARARDDVDVYSELLYAVGGPDRRRAGIFCAGRMVVAGRERPALSRARCRAHVSRRAASPGGDRRMTGARDIDVSGVTRVAFDGRGLFWWGILGFLAIETTMLAICLVSYYYFRSNELHWPPP